MWDNATAMNWVTFAAVLMLPVLSILSKRWFDNRRKTDWFMLAGAGICVAVAVISITRANHLNVQHNKQLMSSTQTTLIAAEQASYRSSGHYSTETQQITRLRAEHVKLRLHVAPDGAAVLARIKLASGWTRVLMITPQRTYQA